MKKVILWGMGIEYDSLLNNIRYEILKKNIIVEAIVCKKCDIFCANRDGFPVISKEQINRVVFDYLVITAAKFFDEIKRDAKEIGIPEEKIIDGRLFREPFFDFSRYVSLIENPVTILSDDCWGGVVYKYLNLKMSSPTINIAWNREEYSKFISNPLFYIDSEFTKVREADLENGMWPVASIGKDGDYVQMELIHNTCFEEAREQWNKRKKRINKDNIFVKMGLNGTIPNKEKLICLFKKLPYKKILFDYCQEANSDCVNINRFKWFQQKDDIVHTFDFNEYMRGNYYYELDILKLLTGEKDFLR